MATEEKNQDRMTEFLRNLTEGTLSEELRQAIEIDVHVKLDPSKLSEAQKQELFEMTGVEIQTERLVTQATTLCHELCYYAGVPNPGDYCHYLCGPGYRRRDLPLK